MKNPTLNLISENNANFKREKADKVLVLYDPEVFFIGDACCFIDELIICKSYFHNATIELNCPSNQIFHLIQNNPFVNKVSTFAWDEIAFDGYDVIIIISYRENDFLIFLNKKYSDELCNGGFKVAIFSVFNYFNDLPSSANIFETYTDLVDFAMAFPERRKYLGHQIYISESERKEANQWLTAKGLQKDETLLIFLDSASNREKTLDTNTYFQILQHFLQKQKIRILNFDENNLGKKVFYEAWLGPELSKKIIFSQGLNLREALRLVASHYTKLVFGPSTGLMHCASGIYNIFKEREHSAHPPMIVYTSGLDNEGRSSWKWWKDSLALAFITFYNEKAEKVIHQLNGKPVGVEPNSILPTKSFDANQLIYIIDQALVGDSPI